jgi:ribosomal subunit interface protein
MQFQFSFKHMHPSQSLQKYAEEKIRHQVEKFVSKPVEAHVTFSVDNNSRRKIVHCALTAGDGFAVQVEHECDDMYGSIDHVLDKLATQLKRKKDRLKDHKTDKRQRRNLDYKFDKEVVDYDNVEVDAEDIIKYEQAKTRVSG